jgi:hypothetical protein
MVSSDPNTASWLSFLLEKAEILSKAESKSSPWENDTGAPYKFLGLTEIGICNKNTVA